MERFKLLVPIGFTVLVSFLVWGIWPSKSLESRFDQILQQIMSPSNENIHALADDVEAFITFQEKRLHPQPGSRSALQIATLYFRFGSALLSHDDSGSLQKAESCFYKVIALYPLFGHGWPYYQLGQVEEKRNSPEARDRAVQQYQTVSLFTSGELSLQANYRIALLTLQKENQSVDARSLYHYLRFASTDVLHDLTAFLDGTCSDTNESFYLKAWIERIKENQEQSLVSMQQFIKHNPLDPSAAYFLDQMSAKTLQPLYPANGNLLQSCYAPQSFQEGDLFLFQNHYLYADMYVPHFEGRKLRILVECENPFQWPMTLNLSLNGNLHSFEIPSQTNNSQSFEFAINREKSILTLQVVALPPTPSTAAPSWIRIRRIHAELIAEREP